MTQQTAGLDPVSSIMREPIQRFTDVVRDLNSGDDASLSLYGSLLTPVFDPKKHTARSVLVIPEVDLSMLRKLSQHGLQFGKNSIAAPLIMTPEYIQASLDTFPLELIEIKQFHHTLFGKDHFEELSFDNAHIRLQCERELKTTLIGLRQGLLAAAGREKFISALESNVGEGILRTLRGLLWLKDQQKSTAAAIVLGEIEKLLDKKLTGLKNAMDVNGHHGWDKFDALYKDVETLQRYADAM